MREKEEDWLLMTPLVARMAELVSQPVVVLDSKRRVRVVNASMEALLGLGATTLVGQVFEDVWATASEEDSAKAMLDEVFAGERGGGQSSAGLGGGTVLTLSWAWSRVDGPVPAALGVVVSRERCQAAPVPFEGDMHYEISTRSSNFGVIEAAWPESDELVGKRCYVAIGRSQTVCSDCPVRTPTNEPVAIVSLPGAGEGYKLVTVEKTQRATARVASRRISGALLSDLLAARIHDLASRQKLSPRERQVLLALVDGRSRDEIAEEMGITPRTVKFHQANMLAKMGADSRADLIRLFF